MNVDRLERLTDQFESALERRDYDTAESLLPAIGEETHPGFVETLRRLVGEARTNHPTRH
jgi:hypothetical protein